MRLTPFLIGALLVGGCERGRIMDEDDADLVGSKRAGSATYNQLIAEGIQRLLDSVTAKQTGRELMKVAFVGIENKGAEELGDIREATNQQIETVIFQAKRFDLISQRYVQYAFKTTGMRAEDLFLKGGREEFLAVLREQGQVPDYLLWAIYTTLSTERRKATRQRDYMLTLELIDPATGRPVEKETVKVRKKYKHSR